MAAKSMRSFRLSPETQKRLTLLAAQLGINQTEALELSVQDFFLRLNSEDGRPETDAEARFEEHAFGPDEALARQWDRLADDFEGDHETSPKLRESMTRLARNTAASLRGKSFEQNT